ncbi:MAG: c-type heme family protein [Inhella sp.]|jgi:HAMP domain-containing protein
MKLLLKFNLVFLIVFIFGLGASSYVARDLLKRQAEEVVVDRARLLMAKSKAVSDFSATQIAPLLQTQMKYSFLPQSIPSYNATEILAALQKEYPDYHFKPAMLNPTNPRDRAVEWEADVIQQFRTSADMKEFVGQRDTPSGPSLYVATPIRITNPACLQCHSTPDAAPKTMLDRYGSSNGFGWTLNDVLGARVVSVPMTVPLKQADHAFKVVMGLLTAVFLAMGLALNLMLWKLVIQPVTKLSALSDRVSKGELEAPEFATGSKDEIGTLAEAFGRMRKSLVHAMKMLDS